MVRPLDTGFFVRDTLQVAREILGKILVYEQPSGRVLSARVVETEAYRLDDPASHAYGLTAEGAVHISTKRRGHGLFAAPGTAYVYLNYGMYWLLNVVTEPEGICGAVLIRAVEPTGGVEFMRENRPGIRREIDLTNGPGKLTRAFGIDGRFHDRLLTRPPLYFTHPDTPSSFEIETSGRIGITRGTEHPWRFYIKNNLFVSAFPGSR